MIINRCFLLLSSDYYLFQMHIVRLHIRTLFIFYQSHNQTSGYLLRGVGGCLLTAVIASHHPNNTSFDYQSFLAPASLNFKTLKPNTRFHRGNQKNNRHNILKERKESGFLNLLTKSFSRLKVLNSLTKKSFIQFRVSSYPHFKSPP